MQTVVTQMLHLKLILIELLINLFKNFAAPEKCPNLPFSTLQGLAYFWRLWNVSETDNTKSTTIKNMNIYCKLIC